MKFLTIFGYDPANKNEWVLYEADSVHHLLCIGKQDQLAPCSSGLGGLGCWIVLSKQMFKFSAKKGKYSSRN